MKRSNRLILLIGIFLAIVAFVGVVLLAGTPGGGGTAGGPTAPPTKLPTVFATVDIPLGTVVTPDMVRQDNSWPVAQREATAFNSTTLVVGKIARRDIVSGAQLTAADFATNRSGLTDISVPAGMRAVAVQVDQLTGVGTLINTGDYVDMIVTMDFQVVSVNPTDQSVTVVQGVDGKSTKLLLQSMQVLGTILPPPPTDANGAPAATAGTTLNGTQEIVILAVTAQQAEVIRFAQDDAKTVSLTLRSPKDFVGPDGVTRTFPPDVVTTGIILKTLVSTYGVLTPEVVQAILPTPTPR